MVRHRRGRNLKPEETQALEYAAYMGNPETGIRRQDAVRARIVLMSYQGRSNKEVAKELDVSEKMVAKWLGRFAEHGLEGLKDTPGRGRHKSISDDEIIMLIRIVSESPEMKSNWSIRTLHQKLKVDYGLQVSTATIHRLLAKLGIKLPQYDEWLESRGEEFARKQLQFVSLALNPVCNAAIVSVNEMAGVGYPEHIYPSEPGSNSELAYPIQETHSLLLALIFQEEVTLSSDQAGDPGQQIIDFLKKVMRNRPGEEFKIILHGQASDSQEKVKSWLAKHQDRSETVWTENNASWLSKIELLFTILTRKVIERGIFTSKEEVVRKTMAYIAQYTSEARSFYWTLPGEK